MIKIISGYSYPSGNALALVNLCNQFNSRGYVCTFYAPDSWHLDKCKSAKLSDFLPETGDHIIVNDAGGWPVGNLMEVRPLEKKNRRKQFLTFLRGLFLRYLPAIKSSNYKLILTCHGHQALPSLQARVSRFNKIHFSSHVNSSARNFFRVVYPTFGAPDFINKLDQIDGRSTGIAGVIEDIEMENKVEVAIEQALQDGMSTVIMFGAMKDPEYYFDKIVPLIRKYAGKVKYAGFIDDRQKMYATVSQVYSAVNNQLETIGSECAVTNTKLHAPDSLVEGDKLTNDQIFQIWKQELGL